MLELSIFCSVLAVAVAAWDVARRYFCHLKEARVAHAQHLDYVALHAEVGALKAEVKEVAERNSDMTLLASQSSVDDLMKRVSEIEAGRREESLAKLGAKR